MIFSIVTARNVYGGEVAQLGTTSPPADFPKLSSLVKLFKPPPTIPPQHIRSHKHCSIFLHLTVSNNLPSVQALNAMATNIYFLGKMQQLHVTEVFASKDCQCNFKTRPPQLELGWGNSFGLVWFMTSRLLPSL